MLRYNDYKNDPFSEGHAGTAHPLSLSLCVPSRVRDKLFFLFFLNSSYDRRAPPSFSNNYYYYYYYISFLFFQKKKLFFLFLNNYYINIINISSLSKVLLVFRLSPSFSNN